MNIFCFFLRILPSSEKLTAIWEVVFRKVSTMHRYSNYYYLKIMLINLKIQLQNAILNVELVY